LIIRCVLEVRVFSLLSALVHSPLQLETLRLLTGLGLDSAALGSAAAARQPTPPRDYAAVPDPLSAMAMKLLAKGVEEHYQTAAGLEADLHRCLAEWEQRAASIRSRSARTT
jgi:hypothetical protein